MAEGGKIADEGPMSADKQFLLDVYQDELGKRMDLEHTHLLDLLRDRGVLLFTQFEDIKELQRKQKCGELLEVLQGKTDRDFDEFCGALQETGYGHLVHHYLSKAVANVMKDLGKKGVPHQHMKEILHKKCNVILSENAIQKRLRKYGLELRKGGAVPYNETVELVQVKMAILPDTVGYRHLTAILKNEGHNVRRDTVMRAMREVDPDGVTMRRRRRIGRRVYISPGPNRCWHVDGYDKLKPYGFGIHGCIDGYSRKILWLKVGPSNNNPHVIARYYMAHVREVKGCPAVLECDPGTENGIMGALQCTFRHDDDDELSGRRSFSIVRSKLNQRIEAWWSTLRRFWSDAWITYFTDLVNFGDFNRDTEKDLLCLRFAFMNLLQHELDQVRSTWNSHHIARSRWAACPNGRPEVLHSIPEIYGGTDCLFPVDEASIEWGFTETRGSCLSGFPEFDAAAEVQQAQHANGQQPPTQRSCLQLYYILKDTVEWPQ